MLGRTWILGLIISTQMSCVSSSQVAPPPSSSPKQTETQAAQSQSLPKVIIFDVNETLLDLNAMNGSVSAALGGRKELLDLWFSTMLHYSLVANAIGEYRDFGEVGVAALLMVAESHKIPLTSDQAKAAIAPIRQLPPHSDVAQGLAAFQKLGVRMVTLTNSSQVAVNTQLKNAGLTSYFEQSLAIDEIKVYKPHLKSYEWALKKLGVKPHEALLVAAHGWDIAGAKAAGLQTAFLARPGKVLYPLAAKPDYVEKDLIQLLGRFKAD